MTDATDESTISFDLGCNIRVCCNSDYIYVREETMFVTIYVGDNFAIFVADLRCW